jgi:L,D-transpeptidase YcbB
MLFAFVALTSISFAGLRSSIAGQVQDARQAETRALVQRLERAGSVTLGSGAGARVVRSSANILRIYEARGFEPLWSKDAVRDLAAGVARLDQDGLQPEHYHASALVALAGFAGGADGRRAAEVDLLATDALLRAANDLRFGKAPATGPSDPRTLSPFDGESTAEDAVEVALSGSVARQLLALRPAHFVYTGLVKALAELRRIENDGGWSGLASGTLALDSTGVRVGALRTRLAAEGYASRARSGSEEVFDSTLLAAVRAFQHHHGLNEDGVVGKSTLAELNVAVGRRIDEVRVNLERARWIAHGLPNTFVAVNVAGAKGYLLRDGQVAFETRLIVGKNYTKSPVFSATTRTIELNPTWTVPRSINGEILAQIRANPGYLAKEGMRVLDASGRALDPASIDFSSYSGASFPYTFRQDAGPLNALGRIKFNFPNPYGVYLHDTPSRSLFEREDRLFSHGCIRVQNPLSLAELLLAGQGWSRRRIDDEIATGVTVSIPLEHPLEVLILYWTASADAAGELHFYRDVYGRDAAVLAALERP